MELTLQDAARIPMPNDNVAIAIRRLDAGTTIRDGARAFALTHTVMEGHRFVLHPIAKGGALLSWHLPFGHALHDLEPGAYICNSKMLETLAHRTIDFALPDAPNFKDHYQPYDLDAGAFSPGAQVPELAEPGSFEGYARDGARGVGTRNMVVILATSSLTSGFARAVAQRFADAAGDYPNLDGVVAVTHTEGGSGRTPNNRDFLLRTLAGFMVHPNVGAVLAVDYGTEETGNNTLREFMRAGDYPLQDVTHSFFTIQGGFEDEVNRACEQVAMWLPQVNAVPRTPQPLKHLKLALQCGGSDAFSGISGNPLAGWVAKELIRHGGAANLAETDELIGAEPYILSNAKDLATAQRFLEMIERFKERAGWHGYTAEGNPSGGNLYRGLYNISLKSIGAARKKDPDVMLDAVLDYGERMTGRGYYFMNSPGNDLESIAGQVASGANLILFITGNGSITNFPFVPTLKFVTTTGRWRMLANEMDVNAGRYQDGMPMDELGRETFDLAVRVAGGALSLGEKAGHSQVSIWRDWRLTDGSQLERLRGMPEPDGAPLVLAPGFAPPGQPTPAAPQGNPAERVGLVVPTSLCSAQVARLLAEHLNRGLKKDGGANSAFSRYVALVHTEGCGAAPGYSTRLFLRTVQGHITHPAVGASLLLEHGCEQTHNDAMRHFLEQQGVPQEHVGFASVQMDGGIDAVVAKASGWFSETGAGLPPRPPATPALETLRLGLLAHGPLPAIVTRAMALLAGQVAAAGGLVVLAENAEFLKDDAFRQALLADPGAAPSIGYGETPRGMGLHIMETPTGHGVETLSAMAATGVEVMCAHVGGAPLQAHPLVPLLQVSADAQTCARHAADLDLAWETAQDPAALAADMLQMALRTAAGGYTPHLLAQGNTDFQLTRGWLGLSL